MGEGEEPRGGARTRSEERTNAPATGAVPLLRASFRGVSLVFGEGYRIQGRRRARPWHRTRVSAPWAHGRSTGRRCDGDETWPWTPTTVVRAGFEGFVFFVCNKDDDFERISRLSLSCFLSFLVVFVVSFVSTIDDLASVGRGREHDESSTRFGHHHSNLRHSKRWWTTIEFDWP